MIRTPRVLLVSLIALASFAFMANAAVAKTSAQRADARAQTSKSSRAQAHRTPARSSRHNRSAQKPVVRWRSPRKIRVVKGGVLKGRHCQVRAHARSGIKRVNFYLDGKRVSRQRRAPWHCKVPTTSLKQGPHKLKAVAAGRKGKFGSKSVTIEVSDPTPAPAPVVVANTASAPTPAPGTFPAPAGWTKLKEWNFDAATSLSELHVYDGFGTSGNTVGGTYKRSNVRVANGELQIVGDGVNGGGVNVQFPRTYGRWEVRARMDAGAGAGPCLVLWPKSDRWPADGEIDFMESAVADRTETVFTNHWGATFAQKQSFFVKTAIDAKQWHEYAVEWESGVIRYYADRVLIGTFTGAVGSQVPANLMSLAMQVDGPNGWIPTKNAQSPSEMVFHIDSVRVYSR